MLRIFLSLILVFGCGVINASIQKMDHAPMLAVYGSSTSGKTTLVGKLKERISAPYVELGLDLKIEQLLKQYENSEYASIYKTALKYRYAGELFTALVRKELDFYKGNSVYVQSIRGDLDSIRKSLERKGIRLRSKDIEGIKAVKELIDKSDNVYGIKDLNYEKVYAEIFKDALAFSKQGVKVILDLIPLHFESFKVNEVLERALNDQGFAGEMKLILVLCPFRDLAQRILKRNAEAYKLNKKSELRVGVFPLLQYALLFNATVSANNPIIDSISYQDIIESVQSLWDKENHSTIAESLSFRLGVEKDQEVYSIYPQIRYDFLLINKTSESIDYFLNSLPDQFFHN